MDAPAALSILSPLGLVGLFFWLVWTGRMVPARHVDRMTRQWEDRLEEVRADRDARLTESHQREQDWKLAHQISEEIRADVAGQIRALTPLSETAVQLLAALPVPPRQGSA